jgi:uncharacterized membrane protein YeaQ/YmgE (transglycosylase-associated protein family)
MIPMTILEFLLLLIVAALSGSVAMALTGTTRGGCLVSIAVGFIGALLGLWIARLMSLPEPLMLEFGDARFPVVWSIAGAALFLAIIGLLTRESRQT